MRTHIYAEAQVSQEKDRAVDGFQTLFDLIGVLARRRYQAAEHHFAALGLNHTEARLLTLLREAGGAASQEALSSQLFIDRSNAGRALKSLEQDGAIVRRKDETDKRAYVVEMTAKGRKASLEIAKLRQVIAQSFFGDLSEKDARTIADLLSTALAVERSDPTSR